MPSVPLSLGLLAAIWSLSLCSPVYCAAPSLNVPACSSQFNYQWSFNSVGQSPCQVAGYLGSVCSGGSFQIPSLGSTTEADEYDLSLSLQNNCTCSSVYYNALSACAGCQGADWLTWGEWKTNCSTVYLVYPNPIPSGTAVPNWAFQSLSDATSFNATEAQRAGDLPESTAPASPTSSLSSPTAGSSTSAAATSSSSSSNNGKSKSNAGAIAGGVVGGLVFVGAVAILAFLLVRSRRRRREIHRPSSPGLLDDNVIPRPFLINRPSSPPPRFYNPSDPSTFPSSQNTLPAQSTGSSQPVRNSHYHSVSDSRYAGMAEI